MTFNPPFAYPGSPLLAPAAAADGGGVRRRCWVATSSLVRAASPLLRDESAGMRGTLLPEPKL